jgi:hypothetical protein
MPTLQAGAQLDEELSGLAVSFAMHCRNKCRRIKALAAQQLSDSVTLICGKALELFIARTPDFDLEAGQGRPAYSGWLWQPSI